MNINMLEITGPNLGNLMKFTFLCPTPIDPHESMAQTIIRALSGSFNINKETNPNDIQDYFTQRPTSKIEIDRDTVY